MGVYCRIACNVEGHAFAWPSALFNLIKCYFTSRIHTCGTAAS